MKEFTNREKGMIKNTAKTVYPMYAKLTKIHESITKLTEEANTLEELIKTWEAGVINLTSGYSTMELCDRELVQIGIDDKGKPINKAVFKLKYEDTVIPPMNEDNVCPSVEIPITEESINF